MQIPDKIRELINDDALFVVSHSGGKDSQAMMIKIRELVPKEQILVIHAELPGVDWNGTMEHAKYSAGDNEFISIRAVKTFFDMVEHRGMWPSPKYRQCTSDLKRGPIEKCIRAAVKNRDNKKIVSCMGLRAEESAARSKANSKITLIAQRAVNEFGGDLMNCEMDIGAAHLSNKLDLDALLSAKLFSFKHDMFGIMNNLNRETGQLENCFRPRFSA